MVQGVQVRRHLAGPQGGRGFFFTMRAMQIELRPGSKHLYWMSHLADPLSHILYKALVTPYLCCLFTHTRGPPAMPFIAYR